MTTDNEAFEKWYQDRYGQSPYGIGLDETEKLRARNMKIGWQAAKEDSEPGFNALRAYIAALNKTHEREIAELKALMTKLKLKRSKNEI